MKTAILKRLVSVALIAGLVADPAMSHACGLPVSTTLRPLSIFAVQTLAPALVFDHRAAARGAYEVRSILGAGHVVIHANHVQSAQWRELLNKAIADYSQSDFALKFHAPLSIGDIEIVVGKEKMHPWHTMIYSAYRKESRKHVIVKHEAFLQWLREYALRKSGRTDMALADSLVVSYLSEIFKHERFVQAGHSHEEAQNMFPIARELEQQLVLEVDGDEAHLDKFLVRVIADERDQPSLTISFTAFTPTFRAWTQTGSKPVYKDGTWEFSVAREKQVLDSSQDSVDPIQKGSGMGTILTEPAQHHQKQVIGVSPMDIVRLEVTLPGGAVYRRTLGGRSSKFSLKAERIKPSHPPQLVAEAA
jgi:hypothetical protein